MLSWARSRPIAKRILSRQEKNTYLIKFVSIAKFPFVVVFHTAGFKTDTYSCNIVFKNRQLLWRCSLGMRVGINLLLSSI